MLLLSLRRNEGVMIGDDVEISIVDIWGDRVRVAIEGPSDCAVTRKEVWEAAQRARAESQATQSGRFSVTSNGPDRLGLKDIFQQFANEQGGANYMTPEQSATAVLDSFKRAVAGELELLDVKDVR